LQSRAQAKYAIGVGVATLLAATASLVLYLHQTADISAYRSASNCASPRDATQGQGCRYQGQAQILSTSRHDRLEATVAFDALPARTFTTSFPNRDEPSSTMLRAGTPGDAELWAGKVTRLAGKLTVDNPESTVQPYGEIAVGFLVGGLVLLAVSAGLAREAWRQK
jgi:hypothetical protein